ncbi:hypothetical protein TSOC_014469 [Tetrabaena socialis]|uniref:Uncharacterized protein n=1 Tax=Tetrabaena socialis TaxID=47790 RepID=A0A2J7ZHP1_9CHLO|nr:hypothetical protein TSOC_014469 [Tetrabaena socialis]|eukprot:PNG99749.1 hypothetical protein TSOC_014469 [Tetrabaena socialis]
MGQVENCVLDTDLVDVFVMFPASRSQKHVLSLPGGPHKIGKAITKFSVLKLPVRCLLGKFDGQSPQEWGRQNSCNDGMWQDAYEKVKGKLTIEQTIERAAIRGRAAAAAAEEEV